MSKNHKIQKLIEEYRNQIFSVDEDYWNGENSTAEQKEKWKDRTNDPLVFDGLLCNSSDESCDILYLLKESTYNGYVKYKNLYADNNLWFPQDRTWNFIQMTNDLLDNPNLRIESIWSELCCWTNSYRQSTRKYTDLEQSFKEFKNANYDVLKNTAIVNIKKTAGETSSIDNLLTKAAISYGDLIRKEVDIIKPKVIFCGDTFEQARIIWDQKGKKRYTLSCGTQYFTVENNENKFVFVDFYHPSATVRKAVLFAYAKEVFQCLRDEGLL